MTIPKRGKTAQASPQKFAPREVKRVDGWEDSEGKVHDHPVKAAAVQAELDLLRLVYHHIDVDEAFDGDMALAKKSVCNMFREHRDLFMQLLPKAYMTPDEFGEAMDRYEAHKRDDDYEPPLSPNEESEAKKVLKHAFDRAWEACSQFDVPTSNDRDMAFDKYWRFRADDLRALLPPVVNEAVEALPVMQPEEAELNFAFTAGFVAAQQATGKSASTMFKKWYAERASVHKLVEDKAASLYQTYVRTHPSKSPSQFTAWGHMSHAERERWMEEARRALLL